MGLDITYYSRLVAVTNPVIDVHYTEERDENHIWRFPAEGYWIGGASMAWSESQWSGRGADLDPDAVYAITGEVGDFRAGSYGGYNQWRDWLAQFASYESAKAVFRGDVTAGPFYELICFADNEGVIGPLVSAKLAKDFRNLLAPVWREARDRLGEGSDNYRYFIEKYRLWSTAFHAAAQGGAVEFH